MEADMDKLIEMMADKLSELISWQEDDIDICKGLLSVIREHYDLVPISGYEGIYEQRLRKNYKPKTYLGDHYENTRSILHGGRHFI